MSSNSYLLLHIPWTEWLCIVPTTKQCLGFSRCFINDAMMKIGGSDSKESACNVGDQVRFPGTGRSLGEGNGTPLQHSWLEIVSFVVQKLLILIMPHLFIFAFISNILGGGL